MKKLVIMKLIKIKCFFFWVEGDRTCLMWTLRVPDDKKGEEAIGIVSDVKRESE